jgi:hypothetical protein
VIFPFFETRNAEGAAEALIREAFKTWRSVIIELNNKVGRRSS